MDSRYKKLFWITVILALIVTGAFSYRQIRKQFTEGLINGYKDSLRDNVAYIDADIQGVEHTLLSIVRNPVVQKVLLDKYKNQVQAQRELSGYVEVSFWHLVTSSNSYVKELSIYSYRNIKDVGNFIHGNEKIKNEEWYKKLKKSKSRILYTENKGLYLVYPVYRINTFEMIGAIKVKLKEERLTALLDNSASDKGWELSFEDKTLAGRENYKDGIVLEKVSEKTGIRLKYFINDREARRGTFVIYLILLISSIIIIGLFLYYNSRLIKEHRKILEEKKKQEYQKQLVLKAQISPHFLYNIMSMINWKAKANGQEEISSICRELSSFYRTALNKGKDEITIEEELLNAESYLKLKLNLSENPFEYEISCPEELKKVQIINFILQPIVENAIIHGIGTLEGNGHIKIKVWEEGNAVFISVTDNGINEELTKEQFFKEGGGYGIKNVHERLEFKYGEDSGVMVNLRQGETEVLLKLYKNILKI